MKWRTCQTLIDMHVIKIRASFSSRSSIIFNYFKSKVTDALSHHDICTWLIQRQHKSKIWSLKLAELAIFPFVFQCFLNVYFLCWLMRRKLFFIYISLRYVISNKSDIRPFVYTDKVRLYFIPELLCCLYDAVEILLQLSFCFVPVCIKTSIKAVSD